MSTPRLQINLFTCGHKEYRIPLFLKMIEEISKSKYIDFLSLYIYAEARTADIVKQYFLNNKPKIKIYLTELASASYPERVKFAHKSECEYSCKMDDDVLMSSHVWDYVYENLDKLTQQTPVIAPIFTNGIPSADLFVQDFLSDEDKKTAHELFLTGPVADSEWGLDYTGVNQKIRSMQEWNDGEYWSTLTTINTKWDVNPVPWYYCIVRGVHPARYSKEYNFFVADKIFENKDKFFDKQEYRLETYKAPYFCNNLFFCKTEYWRDTYTLFTDGWDEGQLTLQMRLDKANPLYIRNGFAIHMAYGMTRGQREIEERYIQLLTQKKNGIHNNKK